MESPVLVNDESSGVRKVLLNRGSKRNAIDARIVSGIRTAILDAPGPALVIASSDARSFSAGADLSLSDIERAEVSDSLYDLYELMRSTSKIIVAAASGHAVGGGAQLLVASDLRVAAPDLEIRFAGPAHGLAVGAWGLPSLIGRGRAMDLCLSMRKISAHEALEIGLVDRVSDLPMSAALELAEHICRLDTEAVAAVKAVASMSNQADALRAEREHNSAWNGSMESPA